MSASFSIALLPGDGIGPEVTREAVRVLDAVATKSGEIGFHFEELPCGAEEYLRNGVDPLPAETLERVKEFDAILLGAMGIPGVRWPTGVEMTPQIDLREKLDLYNGLRPIYLFHADDTPLKNRAAGEIDFVILRESTEGLFAGRKTNEDKMVITRHGAERIIRAGFEQAMLRRRHLTLVDKANVLPSMAFFRKVFDEIGAEYPQVETNRVYVDAAALFMVRQPQMFDVIVTENMFGDILSDLGAALIGGMGMAPSGDIGDRYAVFQPSHGSAPDIAGKGIANPVATIVSAAMMLEWLKHPAALQAAATIRNAVKTVFADPKSRTRDMGGTMTCTEMGEAIATSLN